MPVPVRLGEVLKCPWCRSEKLMFVRLTADGILTAACANIGNCQCAGIQFDYRDEIKCNGFSPGLGSVTKR